MNATRSNVRRMRCPACDAPPGALCTTGRGAPGRGATRISNHAERLEAYRAQHKPAVPVVKTPMFAPKPRIYRTPQGWVCRSSQATAFVAATPSTAYCYWLHHRQPQVRARILRAVPKAAAVYAAWSKK
jgi:hypothetical protein